MGRRKKGNEVKVKVIESKIESVKEIGKEESLEEQLDEEGKSEFAEFMTSGEMIVPILETGQSAEQTGVENIAQAESREQAKPEKPTGMTVNPEFSVYEIARGLGRTDTRERVRYEGMAHGEDTVMQKRIAPQGIDEMQTITGRRMDFVNPELERIKGNNPDGGYYEVKIEKEEGKKDRKMPWE